MDTYNSKVPLISAGIYLKDLLKVEKSSFSVSSGLAFPDWGKYSFFPILNRSIIKNTSLDIERELKKYILDNDNSNGQAGLKEMNEYFSNIELPIKFNNLPLNIQRQIHLLFSWDEADLAGSHLHLLRKFIIGLDSPESYIQTGKIRTWNTPVLHLKIRLYANNDKFFIYLPVAYSNLISYNNSIGAAVYFNGISPENKEIEDTTDPSDIGKFPKTCKVYVNQSNMNDEFQFYGHRIDDSQEKLLATIQGNKIEKTPSGFEKSQLKVNNLMPLPIQSIFSSWESLNLNKDMMSNKPLDISKIPNQQIQSYTVKMQANLMKSFRYFTGESGKLSKYPTMAFSDLQKDLLGTYAFLIHLPSLFRFIKNSPPDRLMYREEALVESVRYDPPGNLFVTIYLPSIDKKYTLQKSLG